MIWIYRLIILTFPMTLFSFNLGGLEFYPAFLLAPLGILELEHKLKSGTLASLRPSTVGIVLFAILIAVHSVGAHFLAKDLLKLSVFILLYNSLSFLSRKNRLNITEILDVSICILIGYGIIQEFLAYAGYWELANGLHSLIAPGDHAAVDQRGIGPLSTFRVASLTLEPSYFSFVCIIYFCLTERKWIRWVCVFGMILAHSMITPVAWLGLAGYLLYKQMKIPTSFFFITVVAAHLIFAGTIYHEIPNSMSQTFFDRYAGLLEFTNSFSWLERLFGSMYVDLSFPVNLIRPFSNLGSILYLFGLLGLSLYLFIFRNLEKEARFPNVIVLIYLCMFNYYYLTSWPYIVAFFFLALEKKRDLHIQPV